MLALGPLVDAQDDFLFKRSTVTISGCVQIDERRVACELSGFGLPHWADDLVLPLISEKPRAGDFVVFSCAPNVLGLESPLLCEASFIESSESSVEATLADPSWVMLRDCVLLPVFALQDYSDEDSPLVPEYRLSCLFEGLAPTAPEGAEPWRPVVPEHDPLDAEWPPLTPSSIQLTQCEAEGEDAVACTVTVESYGLIYPSRPRLSTGDMVRLSHDGSSLYLNFVPRDPVVASMPGNGACSGDRIVFRGCTGPITDGWVDYRLVYCEIADIQPGPRPR
jgi:hypothetical protein